MAWLRPALPIVFVLSASLASAQVADPSGSSTESAAQTPVPGPAPTGADRDLRVQFGGAHESLSGGRDPWRSVTLDVSSTRNGQTVYGAVRETTRFSVLDHQFMAGFSHRLSPRLTAVTELEVSPSHQLLAQWAILGQLIAAAGNGWNVQPAFRHGTYTTASVNMGAVTAERYWGPYRGAYTLYVGHLAGGGVAPSHRAHGDYFYGRYESNVGFSLATGHELENVEFRGVLKTEVRSAAVVGRQWLTPRWFVVYDAVIHKQGTYYTRKRLGLGLGHRF
jgi:YaiO family outer membrane protein